MPQSNDNLHLLHHLESVKILSNTERESEDGFPIHSLYEKNLISGLSRFLNHQPWSIQICGSIKDLSRVLDFLMRRRVENTLAQIKGTLCSERLTGNLANFICPSSSNTQNDGRTNRFAYSTRLD